MSYSRNTSPLPPPVNHRQDCMSAATKRYKYLRRLIMFKQMDFEFAMWQMFYLFTAPQKVYRNFHYRKRNVRKGLFTSTFLISLFILETKSQFARDDPAFLVLLGGCLCVSSVCFAIVLGLGFWEFFSFLLYVIFVDCIGAGLLVATFFWFITNRYFRLNADENLDVEWGYTFDVHLNAFFPPLIILHGCQLFFFNGLINNSWFISRFIGNTFWLVAVTYYVYITFLGYSSLPILRRTHLILIAVPIMFLFYVVTLIIGWNISQSVMEFYRNGAVSIIKNNRFAQKGENYSESVDELRQRLEAMKRMMAERRITSLEHETARRNQPANSSIIDGSFLSIVFGIALVVIITVSIYAFYNLYNAILKKFPSHHTEL